MQKLTTTAAAATLGVDTKALDNILSREASHLVPRGARGKSRRISAHVLELVAVALLLKRDLGPARRPRQTHCWCRAQKLPLQFSAGLHFVIALVS